MRGARALSDPPTGATDGAPAWRAADYDALPLPHVAWGEGVRDRLGAVDGDGDGDGDRLPVLLDAGCGTGRDLEALAARHPGARLVGLDADAAMLARAAERVRTTDTLRERDVTLVQADLGAPLADEVRERALAPVDVVTSIATFHWVPDTTALAGALASLLRPGGRLVAECGGEGQLAAVDDALADLGSAPVLRRYRGPEEWGDALAAAGFDVERVALRPDPLVLRDVDLLARYLEVVVLRLHVAALPEAGRTPFARAVAERLPGSAVDYVRLEVEATRR